MKDHSLWWDACCRIKKPLHVRKHHKYNVPGLFYRHSVIYFLNLSGILRIILPEIQAYWEKWINLLRKNHLWY